MFPLRTYDGNGNKLTLTDGNGHTTTYSYTPDNLVQSVKDALNHVSAISYDRWGQKIQSVDADSNRQRLTSMTYPDASTVTYGYNQLDKVTSMPLWISGSLGYDGYGRLSGFTLANGATKSISYDSQDRLAGLSYAAGSTALTSYTFTYDQASNIVAKNNNTYTYDALNQLIGASENGWFQKKPSDLAPNYATVDRDYLGTTVLSFNAQTTTTPIALDNMASRIVKASPSTRYGTPALPISSPTELTFATSKSFSAIPPFKQPCVTPRRTSRTFAAAISVPIPVRTSTEPLWTLSTGPNSPSSRNA